MIPSTLNLADAQHLAVRACLGAEAPLLHALQDKSSVTIVQELLSLPVDAPNNPPKFSSWGSWENMLINGEMGQARDRLNQEKMLLKQWWMQHLLTTSSPLVERMVMFWHNHFTTSINKVNQPKLLLQQHQLIREHALGNFAGLLRSIARDPAMLIYLDGGMNYKEQPNENFARELLELFTLGEGHYRESDIKAAAKAFTGWSVDRKNNNFVFEAEHHDGSGAVFLGQTVHDGDQVLDIILKHPRTAEHIAEQCWQAFINTNQPDATLIKSWADAFRSSGYEIKVLLEKVLLSDAFWASQNRNILSKSPLDLIVGLCVSQPIPSVPVVELVKWSEKLGQNLFVPPSPKGWAEGKAWITTQSLLDRYSMVATLAVNLPPATRAALLTPSYQLK
ncbi:MAG TPA: DUF1800 domain-containing protein [Thiolinea sp.]|nr:DUF1800 domain-containing protein [Thiolinea sp.]